MASKTTSRACIICLLASLVAMFTQVAVAAPGQNPWAQPGQSPVQGEFPSFPARGQGFDPPGNRAQRDRGSRRGFSPGRRPPSAPYGMQTPRPGPGWRQGQNRRGSYQSTSQPPLVRVTLSEAEPYVQQTVVYTVEVFTGGNVKTLEAVVPRPESVAITKIADETKPYKGRGKFKFATKFRYILTPLRHGEVQLEPVKVRGTYVGSGGAAGRSFELQAEQMRALQVRPADPGARPWLPLHALNLESQIGSTGGGTQRGADPFTLTLSVVAIGAPGDQLPSLGSYLESEDFKLYPESAETFTELSPDGRQVHGRRVERYTLVPQHDGLIRLASIRLAWWNVNTGTQTWALLPERMITAAGQGQWSPTSGVDGIAINFWQVVVSALGAMFGYALWTWLRMRGVWRRLRRRLGHALAPLSARLAGPLGKLSPSRHYRRLRHWLMLVLPLGLKVRHCLRRLEPEQDPAEWSQLFQLFISKHLQLPVHTPVADLTEALIAKRLARRPEALRALMRELDGTLYGMAPLDFAIWKRSVRRAIRLGLIPRRSRATRRPRSALPTLNPNAGAS